MSNPHYTNTLVAVPLTTISSQAVEQQLDAIEAGFDDMTGKADAANGVHTGTMDATGATAVLVPSLTVAETDGEKAANVDYVKAYVGASTTGLPALAGNALRLLKVASDALSVAWSEQYPSRTGNSKKYLRGGTSDVEWADPLPIGAVIAAYTAPDGYIEADGSVYLQSAYPSLFAAIGHPPGYSVAATMVSSLPFDVVGRCVAISHDGDYAAMGSSSSPYIFVSKRVGDTFVDLPTPSGLAGTQVNGVAFSRDGNLLALAHNDTPFVTVYRRNGDDWLKLAAPGTLPASNANGVAWSSDGAFLAVAHSTTPFVTIYSVAGDVFTKVTNPSSLPASGGRSAAFSPDTNFLAVGHDTTPFVTVYSRSGSAFDKLTNPASLPASSGFGVAWSGNDYLAVAHATTPYATFYTKSGSGSGSTLTKATDPVTIPTGGGKAVAGSADGSYFFVGHSTTPFMSAYKRSGSTWSKLTNPTQLPMDDVWGVGLGFDDKLLAVCIAGAIGPHQVYSPWGYDSATEFAVPTIEISKNSLSERNSEQLLTYIRAE